MSSKRLIVALVAAAGLVACESGGKKKTTSSATTRTSQTAARPGYQTATARDMEQGWVPGRPPSATRSTTMASAEAETGASARMRSTPTASTGGTTLVADRGEGTASVRPAAYTAPQQPAEAAPIGGDAFVREALTGDIFEIESSRLALERASDERLREFAQMMVDDHGGAFDRLARAAEVQGVEPPRGPTPRQVATLERLSSLPGEQFDREYSQVQVDAHQRAVRLHELFLQTGRNPQFQAQAEERLPIIRDHLEQARALAEELDPLVLGGNGRMMNTGDRQPMNREGMRPARRPGDVQRDNRNLPPDQRGTQPPGQRQRDLLPPPAPRDTPGSPSERPTGPDQPNNQPPGEPEPR